MTGPSIRRTLLLRAGIGVGLLLCLLSASTYLLVSRGFYQELDASIEQTAALLANEVELENGRIIFEWQEGIGTNPLFQDEGLFQYWNETTGETTRSPALGTLGLPKFHGAHGEPVLRDIAMPGAGSPGRAIGLVVYPFVLPEERRRMEAAGEVIDPRSMPHVLVVARDATPVRHSLNRLRWILVGGTLGTLAIGWILIDRTVRRSLRPIESLARHIRDRSTSNLDAALSLPGRLPVELVGLAEDFDRLLSRVAAIRERERDFIRHAAHELRTPIAGLLATTELALFKPRDTIAYAGHLESCRKVAGELSALVERLSALARLGHAQESAAMQPVDLRQLLCECLEGFEPGLARSGMAVSLAEGPPAATAIADPTLVRIICNNLLDNAVSHGRPGGGLRIGFEQGEGRVSMTLANPVDGFPEQPDRLFEPLFRRNPSSADGAGHLGIGLTLSLEAARAMHGDLRASKSADGWLVFTLELPAVERS